MCRIGISREGIGKVTGAQRPANRNARCVVSSIRVVAQFCEGTHLVSTVVQVDLAIELAKALCDSQDVDINELIKEYGYNDIDVNHYTQFKNIPNSLPWVLLLIFVLIAFRKQVLGGVLIILFGIFTIIFFSALEFIWILFI